MFKAIVLSVASLAMCSAANAKLVTQEIDYTDGGVALRGYLAYDDAGPAKRPGVLVVHEWWGHNKYARSRAEQLAALGYVAFALDMFGAEIEATTAEEAGKLASQFIGDRAFMRTRAAAGLQVLASQKNVDATRIAAIGYCFGGTVALELARSGADLDAVVGFHCGLSSANPSDAKNIRAKVLVCEGADDEFVGSGERLAFVQEMRAAGVDYQMITYGGAVHAFTNPDADGYKIRSVAYNEKADKRSWAAMRQFFDETLGPVGK